VVHSLIPNNAPLEYSGLALNGILTRHGRGTAKVNAAVGGTAMIGGIAGRK
jgi:hypothetical protein